MKPTAPPSWIDLVYYIPPKQKQWPSLLDWVYSLAFVLVFFVIVPWLGAGAGF